MPVAVAAFNADTFRDLLPLYYRRLFPYKQFFEWVTYGNETSKQFQNREFSFTLEHDIYIRYQSFETTKEMELAIKNKNPHKIDIGAIYDMQPKHHKRGPIMPLEKELVFDIDMTDYDEVRSCCQGADVCKKCWKFMAIACKILDKALREDFGYTHLLWVFSGRRGIHCWICDKSARNLDNSERSALAGYLQNDASRYQHPKRDKMHPALRRAVKTIEQEFVAMLIIEQDVLGTGQKVKNLIDTLPEDLSKDLLGKLMDLETSEKRWECVLEHVKKFHASAAGKGLHQFAIEEIMLRFAYPRLDINVSNALNHLLKAPFCVHPKSGKVCVPFNPKTVDRFDPSVIPTLSQLVEEVRDFDEKEKSFATTRKPDAPQAATPPVAGNGIERIDAAVEETKDSAENGNVPSEAAAVQDNEAEPMDTPAPETESVIGELPAASDGEVAADVPMVEPDGNRMEETVTEAVPAEVKTSTTKLEVDSQVILDYKKTSMYKGILVFEDFLRKLKASEVSRDMEDDFH